MITLQMLCDVIHAFSHLVMPECLDTSRPFIEITFQKSKEQFSYDKKKKKTEGEGLRVG